jgi:Domain of unknown function (DUF4112)
MKLVKLGHQLLKSSVTQILSYSITQIYKNNMDKNTPPNTPKDPTMASLDALATLMDNQFRIPGTKFQFGLDSILGVIPGVGDGLGLAISGYLMTILVRKGAGPIIMLRMMGNTLLDAVIGVVPILGDYFDFQFKANRRNVDMLKRYYADGNPKPNAKWTLGLFGIIMFVFVIFAIVGLWKLSAIAWHAIFG